MPVILDATASGSPPSAGETIVLAVVWIGALAASAAAILHHTIALTKLRAELEALEQRRTGAPAAPRNGGTPIFGALYRAGPSLFDRLRRKPVPVLAALAVLLAALSGLLLVREAEQVRGLALRQGVAITEVRAAQDSLSSLVTALRDSVRSVRATAAAAKPPAEPGARPRQDAGLRPPPALSHTTLPPAPSLDVGSPGSK